MPKPSRTFSLPAPGDVRTCSRWSCLQRVPHTGPDPAALHQLVQRVVQEVAGTVIMDAEVYATEYPADHYVGLFLELFWGRVPHLVAAPTYPRALLGTAEERGATCVEHLVTALLPRMRHEEYHLAHNQPFTWELSDKTGGILAVPGILHRLAQDRLTGTLRAYQWRIEDYQAIDWMAPLRSQQIGIALGWLQAHYPGQDIAYVEAYLVSNVTCTTTRSPEELRHLELLLQLQATQAAAETTDCRSLGSLPVTPGLN